MGLRYSRGAALALVLLATIPVARAAPRDEARRHFNQALEAAAAGDYDAAVRHFVAAYELVPHPAVLYNIGRALADAGRYEEAIAWFQRYLETEPADRVEVEGFVATLQARLAEPPPGPPPAATAPPDAARRLAELARELADLAAELEAPPPATPPATSGEAAPEEEGAARAAEPAPAPLEGPRFVEDLYAREVVTASRYGQDPLHAPNAITILDRSTIERAAARTIGDLLRMVPGVDVMELASGQAEVAIRGFNRRLSNKVLVLLDGRSVYVDAVGSPMWATLPVTLDEIERIEIIRGVGSAIYGANAFSGVINIITRPPGEPEAPGGIRVGGGTNGTLQGALLVSGRDGDLAWRASAGTTRLGRWAQVVDLGARPDLASDLPRQDLGLDVWHAQARIDRRLGEQGLASLSAGIDEGLAEFYSLGALRDFYLDQRTTYLRGDLALGPVHLRAAWNRLDGVAGNWTYPVGGANLTGVLVSDTISLELSADDTVGPLRLSAGLGYQRKDVAWDFLDAPHVENHFNGWAQAEGRAGPVILSGAGRVDLHPLVGLRASPRLAAILEIGEGRALRLGGGTAFRTPTFMESYLDLAIPTETVDAVMVRTRGDTTLAPERVVAVDAGYLESASDAWRGELTAFYQVVTDLIDLSSVEPDPALGWDEDLGAWVAGTASFVNEDTVYHAFGGEAAAAWFGLPGLDLDLSYSVERILADEGGAFQVVRSTPLHKVKGGVTWRSPWRVDLATHGQFASAQVWDIRSFDAAGQVVVTPEELPAWFVVSSRLSATVAPGVTLSVAAWNWPAWLVGPHREHPLGQPVGGRAWGELEVAF